MYYIALHVVVYLPHRQTRGENEEPPDPGGISQLPCRLQTGCIPSAAGSSDNDNLKYYSSLYFNQLLHSLSF